MVVNLNDWMPPGIDLSLERTVFEEGALTLHFAPGSYDLTDLLGDAREPAEDSSRCPRAGACRRSSWPSARALLVLSGIGPKDRFTWILEVAPALVAAAVLIATYRRFPLTPLAYVLIFLHACILMVGGHYTYAEVPLGFWVHDAFGLSRNHYDRLGHFAQGFVPAILAREILLRKTPLRPGGWVFFLVTRASASRSRPSTSSSSGGRRSPSGSAADAFLGTQGDVGHAVGHVLLPRRGAHRRS